MAKTAEPGFGEDLQKSNQSQEQCWGCHIRVRHQLSPVNPGVMAYLCLTLLGILNPKKPERMYQGERKFSRKLQYHHHLLHPYMKIATCLSYVLY